MNSNINNLGATGLETKYERKSRRENKHHHHHRKEKHDKQANEN